MAARLRRSASESSLAPPAPSNPNSVRFFETEVSNVLCRVDDLRRHFSTSNLCPSTPHGEIISSTRPDDSVESSLFIESKSIRTFLSKIWENPTIVLLRGPSGSGKSTFAAFLARRCGPSAVVLSTDDFFRSIDGDYRFRGPLISTAHEWNRRRARFSARRGRSPIFVDNTNLVPFEMAPYVRLADEFGYRVLIREPPTDWKRDAGMCALMSRHQVPEKKTKQMVQKFRPIDVGQLRYLMATDQANPPSRRRKITPGSNGIIVGASGPLESAKSRRDVPSVGNRRPPEPTVVGNRLQNFSRGPVSTPPLRAQRLASPAKNIHIFRPIAPNWSPWHSSPAPMAPPLPQYRFQRSFESFSVAEPTVQSREATVVTATDFTPTVEELSRRVEEAVGFFSSRVASQSTGGKAVGDGDDWGNFSGGTDWQEDAVTVTEVSVPAVVDDRYAERRMTRNRTRHAE